MASSGFSRALPVGAGRHRRGRIPAPQYCEKSPQAGRVIGRSLFVQVSVVWRTNLEVPPVSLGSSRAAARTGTASAAAGPIFPSASRELCLILALFFLEASIKAGTAGFASVPMVPNSWIACRRSLSKSFSTISIKFHTRAKSGSSYFRTRKILLKHLFQSSYNLTAFRSPRLPHY